MLKRRLATLAAAPSLEDMGALPGKCHALHGDRAGQYALHLWGSYRLVLVPDHNPLPQLSGGGGDRRAVTKVTIVEVIDYHGD